MRISGEATIKAPLDRVWWALNDPAVLVRTIPGCERLDETGPDAYRMTVTAGVAAIKGTYEGEVRISDQVEPTAFVMRASGAGAPGTVSADVRVTLAEGGSGGTLVTYDADATVGGVLGGVGQRMIAGVARKTAAEFFRNVEDVLTGKAVSHVPPAAGGVPSQPGGLGRVFAAPRVFARPAQMPEGFSGGAVVGAAGALAGVLIGWIIGRRR